jgi:hypothetical protein
MTLSRMPNITEKQHKKSKQCGHKPGKKQQPKEQICITKSNAFIIKKHPPPWTTPQQQQNLNTFWTFIETRHRN